MAPIVVDDPIQIAAEPTVEPMVGNVFTVINCVAVPEQPRIVPVTV